MSVGMLLLMLLGYAAGDCRRYLSNEDLSDFLRTTASLEPDLATVYSIGQTPGGWDIPVLELSAADDPKAVPNLKLIGGLHGDEPIGTQLLITLTEYLIDGYRRDEPLTTWILNNTRVHILPRLNPDGFELAVEGVCSLGPGRENSLGQDLNRGFPPADIGSPEVEALVEWTNSKQFVLSAVLYAGEMVVVYPLDRPQEPGGNGTTPDDDVFRHLGSVYVKNHKSMSKGHSCREGTHFPNGTINGADWYPITGSMQDYNYLYTGTMELTVVMSCCKYPPSNEVCTLWENNRLALLKLAVESCRGVRGRVTAGGRAVGGAVVTILGRDMPVLTNEQGYYFRILLPGKYFIKVESRGMKMKIQDFIVVPSHTSFLEWTTLDLELEPEVETETASYDRGGLDPALTASYESLEPGPGEDSLEPGPGGESLEPNIDLGFSLGRAAAGPLQLVNRTCLLMLLFSLVVAVLT